jgi:diguanylate cyclase (GGDEF)-like protein
MLAGTCNRPGAPLPIQFRQPLSTDAVRPQRASLAQEPAATPHPDPSDILQSIGEVVYDWDIVSDRLTWGPNAAQVLGVGAPDAISSGRRYSELLAPGSQGSRYSALQNATEAGDNNVYHVRYGLNASPESRGGTIWVEDTGRWFAGADGRPTRAHGIVRVITDLYEAERQLEFRSRFDPATGCYNRAHLLDVVEDLLARGPGKSFCVLLAGLENLFVLNRTYGYDVADEAIVGLAQRLKANMRASDHLARYAGNKFALVLDNCDPDQMAYAAQRFLHAANLAPYETSAGAIPATLRIGGVCAPRDGRKSNILFQNAEEALDLARASNDKRFVAYQASLWRKDTRLRAARIADDIVSALNDRRVEIAVQPIFNAKSRTPGFGEALLRLRQRHGALVAPGAVLPIAEQTGMVHLIDHRVLELAVQNLQANPALVLSVNASGATIREPGWAERMQAILGHAPDVARRLIVEITETCAIADIKVTAAAIDLVHKLGARVAMDDFGAGHTSFRNLRELRFDVIKMDGAFVQNLSRSSDDRFFVRTLIDLAHSLQTPLVAEWVETAEAADLLTDWGVDFLQGDYLGKAGADFAVKAEEAA